VLSPTGLSAKETCQPRIDQDSQRGVDLVAATMHAYVITASPSRWQRLVRAVCRRVPRLLAGAGLLLLGIAVFALRASRAVLNLAATFAARLEYEAASRAGKPPVGQTIGVGLAEAFTHEFNRTSTDD
jgi:hypothetical protein